MEVKLKPCPFCGADNKPMGAIMRTANRGEWKHWYNGCVLSGFTQNRSVEQESEQVQQYH